MRDGTGQAFDVGGEGRVVGNVEGRMLADHIDDARPRLLGVVQVGGAIGEARTEMQQRGRRPADHAVVAVGRAGGDAFEQGEHAAHAVGPVEGRHEVHFGCAGIGQAKVDAAIDQGGDQVVGAGPRVPWRFQWSLGHSTVSPGVSNGGIFSATPARVHKK